MGNDNARLSQGSRAASEGGGLERLLKWLEPIIHLFMWVALVAGAVMMLHVSVDVAARALYQPLIGTNEIVSGYYMILIVYLPWAFIARNENHIVADIFARAIPPGVMRWIEVGIKLLLIAYLSALTWQTFVRALQQSRAGEAMQVAGGYLPVWPSRWALPAGAGLMLIFLVLRVIADLAAAFSKPAGESR